MTLTAGRLEVGDRGCAMDRGGLHGESSASHAAPFYPQLLGACRAALEAMRVT